MASLGRSGFAIATLALVLAAGCKDSTGPDKPRVTPREVQKITGDEQEAVRGNALPLPLRVRVIGSDGRPLSGATVQWAITTGDATLAAAQSVTDASGEAETRLTVVRSIGPIQASATVTGVPPVIFSIEGLDPCFFEFAPVLTLGGSRTGALAPLDCVVDGHANDLFVFAVSQQQAISMSVRAASFDPVAGFYPFTGWRLTTWDTVNATRNARLKAIVPVGTYGLLASSFDANVAAPYEISVAATSESAENCEFVLALLGITTNQSLAATDCPADADRFQDFIAFVLFAGDMIRVTHSANAFAPRVQLWGAEGLVAERDGVAGGTAAIEFTAVDQIGLYWVSASSVEPSATGTYRLSIDQTGSVGGPSAKMDGSGARSLKRLQEIPRVPFAGRRPR